ncbi:hypothetical protein D9M69_383850 [compost metagenome]
MNNVTMGSRPHHESRFSGAFTTNSFTLGIQATRPIDQFDPIGVGHAGIAQCRFADGTIVRVKITQVFRACGTTCLDISISRRDSPEFVALPPLFNHVTITGIGAGGFRTILHIYICPIVIRRRFDRRPITTRTLTDKTRPARRNG